MAYRDLIDGHESVVESNIGHEALAELAKKRDSARSEKAKQLMINRIVEHNMRLVTSFVYRRYSNFHDNYLDVDDIIQAGNMGMVRAAKKWDPEKSKFSTYAITWIRSFIQDAMYKKHTVHIPRQVQKENKDILEHYQMVSTDAVGDIVDESPFMYEEDSELPEAVVQRFIAEELQESQVFPDPTTQLWNEPRQVELAIPVELCHLPEPKKPQRRRTKIVCTEVQLELGL